MDVPASIRSPERPRILWLVVDGLGPRHWDLVRGDVSAFPAMNRLLAEGRLASVQPSMPVCETPSALATLFLGLPAWSHGIWGYRMPDFAGRPYRSVSGFSVPPREGRPVWAELEEKGLSYSIMNVAFRNDTIWTDPGPGLVAAYDGYKHVKGFSSFRLRGRDGRIRFDGMDLRVRRRRDRLEIRKGGRTAVRVPLGRVTPLRFTRGTSAFAFPLDGRTLYLFRGNRPVVRGACAAGLEDRTFLDAQVFKALRAGAPRRAGEEASVDVEMAPAEASFALQREIAREVLDRKRADLSVLYCSLVDSANHAYVDTVVADRPEGRGLEVLRRCLALADVLVADLAARCGPRDILVVSSDHGAVPYRRSFHLNELFAEAGLVERRGGRFRFSAAAAYYHPSECGLVLSNPRIAAARGWDSAMLLAAVRKIVRRAEDAYGIRIGLVEAPPGAPWLCLLHPLDDVKHSAAPRVPGKGPLRSGKGGGHHLSPLCPTPWIPATLGLWSPDPSALPPASRLPSGNEGVKSLVLDLLDGLTTEPAALESAGRA